MFTVKYRKQSPVTWVENGELLSTRAEQWYEKVLQCLCSMNVHIAHAKANISC